MGLGRHKQARSRAAYLAHMYASCRNPMPAALVKTPSRTPALGLADAGSEQCAAFQSGSWRLAITQGTLGNSSCPKLLALEALSSSEHEVPWVARALSTWTWHHIMSYRLDHTARGGRHRGTSLFCVGCGK